MLSAEGNCNENLSGLFVFCLIIPTLDVEKTVN